MSAAAPRGSSAPATPHSAAATRFLYGQSIAAGLLRCDSAESGMTCTDTETGRGFTLSIATYKTF